MGRHVILYKFTEISEECTASIFRFDKSANLAILPTAFWLFALAYFITVMMEEIRSPETRISAELHGVTFQKTVLYLITAVRTSNPIE
jgi:hypothetical protein